MTRVPYNYIAQGSREVNNGRAAEAEMFKMGARSGGILGTYYLTCSRPDWYGVPGIANSENLVLTS